MLTGNQTAVEIQTRTSPISQIPHGTKTTNIKPIHRVMLNDYEITFINLKETPKNLLFKKFIPVE